jgi:hypothetical protein
MSATISQNKISQKGAEFCMMQFGAFNKFTQIHEEVYYTNFHEA